MDNFIPSRGKILIVDDAPSNIQILNEILQNDYEILFATRGERAIELAENQDIDLVLLDIMMPELNGYEVCQRLKAEEKTRDIPVIFITGMSEIEDETRGFEAGAVDYICKPISPPVVRARIKTHLEIKKQRDVLNNLSYMDRTTGIYNRHFYEDYLKKEWNREARNKTILSVILIDIDFFKLFNDRYGHTEGDLCLHKVAQALANTLKRSIDIVARYGGEEFCCILPGTNEEGAKYVAENLCEEIVKENIPHADSKIAKHVTISLGVATTFPVQKDSALSLVKAADLCLYKAKERGRNQVVSVTYAYEES